MAYQSPRGPVVATEFNPFKDALMSSSFLKAAFMGFAGDGKTYTAVLLAIGLVKYLREKKDPRGDLPVYFFDTENGSDWAKPLFDKAGIKLQVWKSQAFVDLCRAVALAEEFASVLLVDSVSHPWKELVSSYLVAMERRSLIMTDWNFLKDRWTREFTDKFVNAKVHAILCGRAAYEYDHFTGDDGKKQVEKTGVKMRAEGELGYEPNLVVLMEREHDENDITKVYRVAHILKDRGDVIDEKKFRNPTFESFKPHIALLNIGGGVQQGVDMSRSSVHSQPKRDADKRSKKREVVISEIEDVFTEYMPGQTAEVKKRKVQLVRECFGAPWKEVEELMSLERCIDGFNRLHRILTKTDDKPEGEPSRYEVRQLRELQNKITAQRAADAAQRAVDGDPVDGEPLPDFTQLASTSPNTMTTIKTDGQGFVTSIEEREAA